MKGQELREEIDRMALSEKLLLVEDIWDSIAASNAEIPMPEWQKQELDRRHRAYREGKLELHDWESVHKALREKHK